MDYIDLIKKAAFVRISTLETIAHVGKGHIGGALSCTDILVSLYFGNILRFDAKQPNWENRDRFILSKGHAGIALYVILAELGFFDKSELEKFNNGGMLGEHPDHNIPGIEIISGSLGHGLGIGSGMALSAKMDKKDYSTIVLLGDGECYEGSVWESLMFASHHQLNNLFVIVDRNRLCIHGNTEEINKVEPLGQKFEAFGWEVIEINGHDFKQILNSFQNFRKRVSNKPLAIIANTIKGKGVSFMENQASWHHGNLSPEKLAKACNEINESIMEIKA